MSVYTYSYNSADYDPAAPMVEITVTQSPSSKIAFQTTAFVDSGADATMLPIDILNHVKARYIETRQMRGATGHTLDVDTYLVTIQVASYTIRGIQAIAMHTGHEVVLGRDVLNQLEIILNGPAYAVEILG